MTWTTQALFSQPNDIGGKLRRVWLGNSGAKLHGTGQRFPEHRPHFGRLRPNRGTNFGPMGAGVDRPGLFGLPPKLGRTLTDFFPPHVRPKFCRVQPLRPGGGESWPPGVGQIWAESNQHRGDFDRWLLEVRQIRAALGHLGLMSNACFNQRDSAGRPAPRCAASLDARASCCRKMPELFSHFTCIRAQPCAGRPKSADSGLMLVNFSLMLRDSS